MKEIERIYGGYFNSSKRMNNKKYSTARITDCYELEFFDSDYFYTVIDDVKYPLKQNTIIIAKPNQKRYSKLHFCCKYFHIYLTDGELKEFFDNCQTLFVISNPEEYSKLFNRLARFSISADRNYYKIKSELYSLIDKLSKDGVLSSISKTSKANNSKNAVIDACKFIEENFNQDIKLKDIADSVYLHPNYFLKLFKKYYGVSPSEYLNEVRIEHAKYMLTSTEDSVSQIALSCGFGSQTYFSSVFKKQTGQSPTEYLLHYNKNI